MKHPPATLVLAVLAFLAAIAAAIVALQFLDVVPRGDRALEFWGGDWIGALMFGGLALLTAAAAWGWLTLQPWAFTITVLLGLIGLSIPVSSLIAGTETWSTALLPIILNGFILLLTLSKSARQATKPGAAPAPAKSGQVKRSGSKSERIDRADDI